MLFRIDNDRSKSSRARSGGCDAAAAPQSRFTINSQFSPKPPQGLQSGPVEGVFGTTGERHGLDSTSDRDLAIAAANGERTAFAALIERHYDRIHRLAWRLTGNAGDAEDVAQDVCVKLASAIRNFRGESEFGTWIWRITYNAAIDLMRSRQRVRLLEPSEVIQLADSQVESEPSGEQDTDELWAAVRRLSGQQRDAVLLVYGEEMSHGEAAVVMGCTEKTVSWHLHEARKRLKAMLTAGDEAAVASPSPATARVVPLKITRGA
jgi:RNA polymerase sigma-70 factor, ECF subfamily